MPVRWGCVPFYYADGLVERGRSVASQPRTNLKNGLASGDIATLTTSMVHHVRFGLPMRDYMKTLIISPKNNTIYTTNKIPLELYTAPEAKRVVVKSE